LFEIFNPGHGLDNIKFDDETNSIHAGASIYSWGNLQALLAFPKDSTKGAGGLVEFYRAP
jgi:hypothetical protein